MPVQQLSLEVLAPRTLAVAGRPWGRRNPVFLALAPPLEKRAQVIALATDFAKAMGSEARVQRNPHVSLLGLGDLDDMPADVVDAVTVAVSHLAFEPFEVVFDRVQSFAGGRVRTPPLVLRLSQGEERVVMLGQMIRRALIAAGLLEPCKWTFVPHLTLLRGPRTQERRIPPIGWTVREFVLVHSERPLGRHNLLGRFAAR